MRARREMPIEIRAADQLSQRRKKIRRRGTNIGDLSPEQLHRLRIQVKKARYAAEFFSSVYTKKKAAKRCEKVLSSLMRLQNCLGGINDVVTRKALFAEIIANPRRGLTAEQNYRRAFAAGLIIGNQQALMRHLLDGARKAHSRFDSAKVFWKLPRPRSVFRLLRQAAELRSIKIPAQRYYNMRALLVPRKCRTASHSDVLIPC